MAKSVNQVILLGRLTRDAELRSTSGGKNVTEFSLAVDKGNDQAAFFDVVAWEKTAELVSQYTQKGSKVLVQEIGYKSIEITSWCSEYVQADEENLIGEPFYKILNGDTMKFSSFQTARKMKNKYEKCYRSWGY